MSHVLREEVSRSKPAEKVSSTSSLEGLAQMLDNFTIDGNGNATVSIMNEKQALNENVSNLSMKIYTFVFFKIIHFFCYLLYW